MKKKSVPSVPSELNEEAFNLLVQERILSYVRASRGTWEAEIHHVVGNQFKSFTDRLHEESVAEIHKIVDERNVKYHEENPPPKPETSGLRVAAFTGLFTALLCVGVLFFLRLESISEFSEFQREQRIVNSHVAELLKHPVTMGDLTCDSCTDADISPGKSGECLQSDGTKRVWGPCPDAGKSGGEELRTKPLEPNHELTIVARRSCWVRIVNTEGKELLQTTLLPNAGRILSFGGNVHIKDGCPGGDLEFTLDGLRAYPENRATHPKNVEEVILPEPLGDFNLGIPTRGSTKP